MDIWIRCTISSGEVSGHTLGFCSIFPTFVCMLLHLFNNNVFGQQVNFGPYAMVIWLACTIVFLVYQVFFIPETQGKSVEGIPSKIK